MNLLAMIKQPPLCLNQEDAIEYLGSYKLFTDMRAAGWIEPVVNKHKLNLYDRAQLDEAWGRVRNGEYPAKK